MELTFRALGQRPDDWKPVHATRPRSLFQSSYPRTLNDLSNEVRHLKARNAFVQVDVPEGQVRNDGQLYAKAVVNHPGVMVTIELREGPPIVVGTDVYDHWHDNLRAIALGLHDMRRLDRYGIAKRGQQYAGFRAIGSGTPMGAGAPMSPEAAARLLCDATLDTIGEDPADVLAVPSVANGLLREAAKVHHPDRGGDPDVFRQLTEARDVLVQFGAS